jgi:leucyl-tRNA synthetase
MDSIHKGGYDHKEIEGKWQDKWQSDGIYTVQDKVEGKKNYFTLVEFTYPSGDLHVGHWYAFAVPDIIARHKRMQGFNVLYPMGFDAFGLPAENAAIKFGADPKVRTYEQMDRMRKQFYSMGAMFDWSREIVSCDPVYFKWTQWMFNQFLKHDLVYRAVTKVNWCPIDQTVLANEQVVDGKCERCGSEVIQRSQEQWMLRISKYADRLIDDLDALDWPHAIKESQKNWIGRSEGSEIPFKIISENNTAVDEVKVFTTRADTIFGVTYLALAPEHPWVGRAIDGGLVTNAEKVQSYILETKKKSELDRQQSKEKTGVELQGFRAINPANGEEIPVWIADYVLAGYGTGAVMGVPQHDERDREFATAHAIAIVDQPLVDAAEITARVGGEVMKTYRLRDWGISRQRYWGCPIPIVYDPDGNAHPIPDEHLPWVLPTDVDHTPDGTAPLARSKELFERTERIFGAGWKPEVETMDTFVDSSWYFYRYLDPKNDQVFADQSKCDAWMPIDLYMGGAEHTTMHLLYSRFWVKALYDLGLVKDSEAYVMRRNRGLILGPDGNKMSKSKGNVINPDEIVDRLGADTVRMYLAFMGPYGVTTNYPWDPNGVVGVRRFLERVWKLKNRVSTEGEQTSDIHKTIKKVGEDIEEYKLNTAIASMMSLLNVWEKLPTILESEYKLLLKILAPFAPHMTEEIWHELKETESIHLAAWPTYNASLIVEDTVVLAVQINGKVRAELSIAADASKEDIEQQALGLPRIQEYINGALVKKIIVVPGRVINIVI